MDVLDVANFEVLDDLDDKQLTAQETQILKERLLDRKNNLLFNRKYSDEFNFDQEDLSDDIDHASAQMANFHQMRFRNRENFYEKKIDEALVRIDKNTYGICNECGGNIKFARLLARPTADFCVECKEESEKDESNSMAGLHSKSSGRMLGNYIGIIQ